MTQDIAIVGGGICGLALAINLYRRGIRAHVFEAAPEIRELGGGHHPAAPRRANLRRWGLNPRSRRRASRTAKMRSSTASAKSCSPNRAGVMRSIRSPNTASIAAVCTPSSISRQKAELLNVGALMRDADTILEYPMVDRDPVARWSFERVTLAGDAAHPMYPRGSNGSAQALIDARVLAERLAASADPVAAFAAYEAERRPTTNRIVETNRVSPPDVINLKVEELTGDRPFDNLADFTSQDELRALSDRYKKVAGFEQERVAAS